MLLFFFGALVRVREYTNEKLWIGMLCACAQLFHIHSKIHRGRERVRVYIGNKHLLSARQMISCTTTTRVYTQKEYVHGARPQRWWQRNSTEKKLKNYKMKTLFSVPSATIRSWRWKCIRLKNVPNKSVITTNWEREWSREMPLCRLCLVFWQLLTTFQMKWNEQQHKKHVRFVLSVGAGSCTVKYILFLLWFLHFRSTLNWKIIEWRRKK